MTAAPPPVYAAFGRRLRALVIDSVVLAAALVAIVLIGDAVRHVPGSGRVLVLAIYALILYEPIMVWRYGATLGHMATNLRVVNDATGGNPGFPRALARFVIKTGLGVFSFVAMAFTRRYQAVHDAITHTTVQIRDVAKASEDDFHPERVESTDHVMPSRVRRIVTILIYSIIFYFGLGLAVLSVRGNQLAIQIIGLAWLGLMIFTIIAGWRGELLGARRKKSPP